MTAALVACGGGGGGGGGGLPAAPASTPAPAGSSSQYPIASGDAFTFAGNESTAVVYAKPTPSPLPSTLATAQIAQSITVTSATYAGNGKPAQDVHTVESDAYATQTTTLTTDAYYAYVPAAAGTDVVDYGYTAQDELHDSITYAFGTPQTLAQLPFAAGSVWSNSPQATITQTDADGTRTILAYAADGSYSSTQSLAYGSATIIERADGSGSYSSPVFLSALIGGEDAFDYSAPSTGSQPAITITGIYPTPAPPTPIPSASPGTPTPTPNPTTPPRVVTVPAWYAPGTPLYSETDTDAGSATIPASCSVPAQIGTQGEKLVQTIARLDTILGYTETQNVVTYVVPNFGPACIVMNDVTKAYYDYTGDTNIPQATTAGLFAFYGTPYETTTIAQTLTLQQATVTSSARRTQSAAGIQPIGLQAMAAGRAAFLAAVTRERTRRVQAMQRAVRRYLQGLARSAR